MSEDSDYVCTLDNEALRKAREELNEIPEDRLSAVQAFRDWINNQPHINCPKTDTLWLLRFLRSAKFNQHEAREKLEKFLSLNTTYPHWFSNIDSNDPNILKFYENQFGMILPRPSRMGHCVILIRFEQLYQFEYVLDERIRSMILLLDYASMLESTQVHGLVVLLDCGGATSQILSSMLSAESQKFQKLWQDGMPGRFKGVYFYRAGVFFESAVSSMKSFVSNKNIKRLKCIETAESLYTEIPMESLPVEYLPDDYTGPSAGSLQDISRNMVAEITVRTYREDLLYRTSSTYGIDEAKRLDNM